ncbi:MAG: LemA family protein [Planctomycetes bacterium]|nr:LemA family protein [Planctomycetota bacterium]
MIPVYIAIGIGVVLALWVIAAYNGLVGLRNQVQNAWSQIDVQLKRRYDLIPNLVNTAKGYLKHEQTVLENVTKARSACMNTQGVAKQAEAENFLTQSLKSLFAVVESYPDLKANQNMLALQEELTATENKISFARQFYNDVVMRFNNKTQMFPSNIIAGMFGFKQAEFFATESAEEKKAPKVEF